MKHRFFHLIIVSCSFLLSLTVRAEQVQIATFHYPPVMDSSKQYDGLMGEIVQAAFHQVNIETNFVYYPAKRILLNFIGTEKVLASIGPVALIDRQPEDRKNQVICIPPLANIIMVFAYYKPTHGRKPTTYEQMAELKGFRVGTIQGSNTIPLLKEAGIDVYEASIDSQIRMLKANRIDFAAVGLLTGLELITKLYPGHEDEFGFIRKPILELPTSIYFNKRYPKSDEFAEHFRTGLNSIVKSGKYLQILKNYYGKNKIPSEYKPIFRSLGVQYSFNPNP